METEYERRKIFTLAKFVKFGKTFKELGKNVQKEIKCLKFTLPFDKVNFFLHIRVQFTREFQKLNRFTNETSK